MNQTIDHRSGISCPLVSIVIPAYNVEDYLHQSMDSVVNQTYKNLEIICVNDGSTDHTGEILAQYSASDSRILLIDQSNQGASAARNNGMGHATGKYIIFWDPDDYFHPDAIKLMVEKAEAENADVCVCDAQHFYADTGEKTGIKFIVPPYPKNGTFSWKDCPEHIFHIPSSVPWNKLVLRSLLAENDILFPDVPYLTDVEYMFLVMCCAKRITICNRKLIYYRQNRPNCLVQTKDNGPVNVVSIYRKAFDELNRRNLLEDPAIRYCFFSKTANMYHYRIRYCRSFEEYEKLYSLFFSPESPLSEYDPASYKVNQRIMDLKELSAGDYLLVAYKQSQKYIGTAQKTMQDSLKRERKLKADIAKLTEQETALKQKNKDLKDRLKKIKASRSFKTGKAVTYLPRKIKDSFSNDK